MKILRWISILVLILGVAPSRLGAQGAKTALTNHDVVDMVKTGLSNDVVIAKIKTSSCQFDTSTEALKDLKAAGISDSVILAMVQASTKTAEQGGAADPAKSDASGSDFAHVRIYRPRQGPGTGFNPSIFVDGKEVARLPNNSRFSVRVSPGSHIIKSDDKSSMISIDAKGGQEFFISVQELPGGFFKGRGKLTLVMAEQGRPEYKLAKPLDEERKIEKGMIEDDADKTDHN